jgi:hypothetical protein
MYENKIELFEGNNRTYTTLFSQKCANIHVSSTVEYLYFDNNRCYKQKIFL